MIIQSLLNKCQKAFLTLAFLLIVLRCSDEELVSDLQPISSADLTTTTASVTEISDDCSACTYVVPAGQQIIDGAALGLKPGSVIGLNANFNYGSLTFINIIGTSDNPIIIRNCGGTANITATDKWYAFKTKKSKFFRVTGGSSPGIYGINIQGGEMGMTLESLSTNFEVDHVQVSNAGFAGIMAKTDPGCDEATWRGNFTMENVDIHDNYIHHTGGEGIYAGNSFFSGMNTPCGVKLPHEIHNIRIFKNIIKYTGWDGLQLGCATQGASIFSNTVENYGVANQAAQNNGIQISSGTGGLCYNNLIRNGTGVGLIVFGLGDNVIYNNIIHGSGSYGIFCDERASPGPGYKFLNNTILNPALDGIRIYAELVPQNVIVNNIVANPGSGKFLHKLNEDVNIELANNYFIQDTDALKLVDLAKSDYRLQSTSPVIDMGKDISLYYNIQSDFYELTRLNGESYDIGAVEGGNNQTELPGTELPETNILPKANAGVDQNITTSTITLRGSATDSDGSITTYKWTQYAGPTAVISNPSSATPTVTGLVTGDFYFRLTVQDNDGGTDIDNILVRVQISDTPSDTNVPEEEPVAGTNEAPVANAGSDKSLSQLTSALKLYGSATDSDGTIVSYKWTQYGGPTAVITEGNTAAATIDIPSAGNYYFRLTVTDNAGATDYDNVLVRIQAVITAPVVEAPVEEEPVVENVSPLANAGSDRTVALSASPVLLYGSATDSDGTIASYKWTQYGGPVSVISNASSATAAINFSSTGNYYFRLTVTDNDGAINYDNVLVRVEAPIVVEPVVENVAPFANAGSDRTITQSTNPMILSGSATDKDGTIVSYRWTQYGGPAAVIGNANSATASVQPSIAGNYYFRLTVQDNDGATDYDNVLVVVKASSVAPAEEVNAAPVSKAGPDKTITLPTNTVTLYGSASDTDGSIVSYKWTQYGGPAAVISNANARTATITTPVTGNYYFRLTVKDNDGATDYDNILVRVLGAL